MSSERKKWTNDARVYGLIYAIGFGLWELADYAMGRSRLSITVLIGTMLVGFLIGYTVHRNWDRWMDRFFGSKD